MKFLKRNLILLNEKNIFKEIYNLFLKRKIIKINYKFYI